MTSWYLAAEKNIYSLSIIKILEGIHAKISAAITQPSSSVKKAGAKRLIQSGA
ncbi:MAG: hypothetical protein WBB01_10315 [Phormidesmis sp.]